MSALTTTKKSSYRQAVSAASLARKTAAASSAPKLGIAMDAARICTWSASAGSLTEPSVFPTTPGFLRVVRPVKRGDSWFSIVHPIDQKAVQRFFDSITISEIGSFIEYRLRTLDGDSLWVRHWVSEFDASTGRIAGALAEIEEIRWLRRESIHISEREQNRIGQELHDDLCQVLAGLGCLLRVLENRVASRVPEEVANLREINRQMVEAMERTRALTHGLFPARLKTLNIREALAELGKQIQTRFQVEFSVRFQGPIPQHGSDAILNVYRIAQEAASNAIRHGGATRIEIGLRRRGQVMELTLKDNGSGYSRPGDGAGIGMEIMRNRARMLGGEMTVSSKPGQGVTLIVKYQANM
jgi:signal transduction histidine kinase